MSLPEGYQTRTGDRGVLLSGGQRQRVALARALLGRPKLLVLDEATSALDNESERLIQEAIRSLHGSVTVFMIAHRLSTTESADWVLVLEDGTITGQGSPAELAADPASYLSRMQDL
ncbi:MAG: ABC-type multidrug transport system, ATPase and permease component [Parcubacteria group bacterium GW2011_GWB1_57_6]|nr:MAG: ABC-type multidrug transport system, ATPase and permease component [Parcubacteria group bacterium GW2011_GWB1_57_6]